MRKPPRPPEQSCNASESSIRSSLQLFLLPIFVLGLLSANTVSPLGRNAVAGLSESTPDVTIGVFGLFHPHELTLSATGHSALVVRAGEERIALERSSGIPSARLAFSRGQILITSGPHSLRADRILVGGRKGQPVDFELAVPHKITRRYHGTLEIKVEGSELIAIVQMDEEVAVASVVAAESAPATPLEMLKAQAVATRSYLIAGRGRHEDFDFCDTTHCQVMRETPEPRSSVANAVQATRGMVLTYESKTITAMYTRSCSGRTHTPSELNMSAGNYPYYPVECAYCRSHPVHWASSISREDAIVLRPSDESSRLKLVRRKGWNAVPSNDFVMAKERDYVLLKGVGQGHGIGLCQAGAKAMAETGADFRQILAHYYPNTTIESTIR